MKGLLIGLALCAVSVRAELYLPGTQPNENGIELGRVAQCVLCHSGTTNGQADPYFSWSGGMMAQAARDPVFRAALAIANQDRRRRVLHSLPFAPRLVGRTLGRRGRLPVEPGRHARCEL